MDDPKMGLHKRDGKTRCQPTRAERLRIRTDRAKVMEQATYRLTNVFTVISGRIEILSEMVPTAHQEELAAIREELKKGMELNRGFLLAAQACQRETAGEKLGIVLADDNASVLRMLCTLLVAEFQILAAVSAGSAALDRICALQPDVAILDLQMPALTGIEVINELRKSKSHTAVVICSGATDAAIVQAALDAGAAGYVYKARAATDLVLAVNSVARGERFVSPSARGGSPLEWRAHG